MQPPTTIYRQHQEASQSLPKSPEARALVTPKGKQVLQLRRPSSGDSKCQKHTQATKDRISGSLGGCQSGGGRAPPTLEPM